MFALSVDLLEPECIGANPVDLLEVQRAPLPPPWCVHTGLHQRSPRLEHADADLERLRLADGVVDDVDRTGIRHRKALQRPPHHAASSSTTASRGSCGSTLSAPNRRANCAWASKRATTATAACGYSARSTASAHKPRDPAPYTTTRPDDGGGCRVIACSVTENGSANTATSSGTESGTANNMLSWAGISSA